MDTLRNTLTVSRLLVDRPDLIHSFGRLAYLAPILPLRIPKIMTYQRDPSVVQIKRAVSLARSSSLAFTGCSHHIADRICPNAPAYPVYNGVPLDTYDFQPSVADDAPLVFLGRIAPIKGTHTAIKVARRSGRPLVVAGNVPDEEQQYFRERVKPHIDGHDIQYVGPVNDAEKNELLGRAAAFLMPIQWEEPFGIVMAEAMACGTPVIGTRRGAVPEVVEPGVTGFVGDTTDDLVEAVGRIGELDRRATRERCERLFSARAIVDAYEDLYEARIAALSAQNPQSRAE
jgi:glycosyltransferase involved in cell wall biosynthesis